MVVYENTLKYFFKDIRAKRLVNFLCAEYEAATGKPVSGELRYAWKYAFDIIYSVLTSHPEDFEPGMDYGTGVRIDLEENIQTSHLKLTFAASDGAGFRYSIIGLYAGSGVKLTRADDIVSFREGNLRWTTLHPSLYMSSFAKRLFRGIPAEEAQNVNYESASFLFDCFYSPDTDILSDYDDQLTDEFPIFYANDTGELTLFLSPVLTKGGGQSALRNLSSIEALSASGPSMERNEDQIYLISSITNNVRRNRKAWYIIEGQNGTGKDEIVRGVSEKLRAEGKTIEILGDEEEFWGKPADAESDQKEFAENYAAPEGDPDLVVVSQEAGGIYEDLEYAKVGIFLCDGLRDPNLENFEKDAKLTSRAEKAGAQLYISHLKQADYFVDGGKGMRWLVNRLQLANIRREDYDPAVYEIRLVNSKEESGAKENGEFAFVTLPENVTYNSETGRISFKKSQKKGIYNAISSGRKGVLIECQDPALKTYLEKELFALKQRQLWVRRYVSELIEEQKNPEKQKQAESLENSPEAIKKADSLYNKKIKSALGRGAFFKLCDQSKIWLASALMAYDGMKNYDRMVDFSGVCVQIGKACEYELKKRFFTRYVEYQKEKYGESHYLKKLPDDCFAKSDGSRSGQKKLLEEDKITLGKLGRIMGLDDNGRIADRNAWEEFRAYADNSLLVKSPNTLKTLREHLVVINKIKDEYRNPSAHSYAITIVDARECIEYVITVQRKLGVLLDQYRE